MSRYVYVFDATPLIYLAKADRLDVLSTLDGVPMVPGRVYTEVVDDGIDGGYADARRIERAFEEGHLDRQETPETDTFQRLGRNGRISEADAAVIALAADRDAVAVMDERAGRQAADAEGVTTRGTAFALLERLREGELSADETRTTVDRMVDAGWHCSTGLYARISARIEELD